MTTAEGLSLRLPLQAHSALGGLREEDFRAQSPSEPFGTERA